MNPVTQLRQIIESMQAPVTVEQFGQFSRTLSRIGTDYKTPVVMKLVNMMNAAGQYLGLEDPGVKQEVLSLLSTLSAGLDQVIREPSDRLPDGCQTAFGRFKARLDARPLVSPEEMERLKAVILSVDWEISDETLRGVDKETAPLMRRLRFHRTLYPFLKIINSLGRYMASKKASVHKDTVSFLQSVFDHFEQAALDPSMSFRDKKQLIGQDIAAFNVFKKKISSSKPTPENIARPTPEVVVRPASDVTVHPGPEVAVRPALSHVDAPRILSDHSLTPLENSMDPEPALASFKPLASKDADPVAALPEAQDRDIMGDLFSPKESDADRLMDRIHRSLVSNQDPTGCGGDDDPEGFENLIPRRMDQDPIPEISSRLDAFFDLASSTVQPLATESDHSDATVAPDSGDAEQVFGETLPLFEGEEEAPPEKLILLDPDEDSDARSNVGRSDPAPLDLEKLKLLAPGDDPVDAAMARLRNIVAASELDPDTLAGAEKDLSQLKSLWQRDPDKCLLVDVAARLIEALGCEAKSDAATEPEIEAGPGPEADDPSEPEQESDPAPDPESEPPRKFWQIFSRRRRSK